MKRYGNYMQIKLIDAPDVNFDELAEITQAGLNQTMKGKFAHNKKMIVSCWLGHGKTDDFTGEEIKRILYELCNVDGIGCAVQVPSFCVGWVCDSEV